MAFSGCSKRNDCSNSDPSLPGRFSSTILFVFFSMGLYSQCMQPLPVTEFFTSNELQFAFRLSFTSQSPDCNSNTLPAYFWFHRNAASTEDSRAEGKDWQVWPNPADSYVYLESPTYKNERITITMVNFNNQIIKKILLPDDNRIFVGDLAPSCYFLIFANEKGQSFFYKKLIICR